LLVIDNVTAAAAAIAFFFATPLMLIDAAMPRCFADATLRDDVLARSLR